jgi:hypothetical protein
VERLGVVGSVGAFGTPQGAVALVVDERRDHASGPGRRRAACAADRRGTPRARRGARAPAEGAAARRTARARGGSSGVRRR